MNRSPPSRQNNLYADRRSAQVPTSPYKSMSRSPPANALSLYQPYSSYHRSPPQANSMSLYRPRRPYPYERDYYMQYSQYPQQYSQYPQQYPPYPRNPSYAQYPISRQY